MLTDYHVHTDFSDDSEYRMEDIIKDAISLGLDELCFTDHVDYGIKRDWDDARGIEYRKGAPGEPEEIPLVNVRYESYYKTFRDLKNIYGDEIGLKFGLEFGMQMHTIPQYEKLFQTYPFDFIILSVHEIEDKEFWTQDFQVGRSQQEYNERYYEEILNLVKNYHHYSVLGHLDLISRYDINGKYPFSKTEALIRQIFEVIIADGKGIEINTSCHRYGLSDLTPSRDILRLYRHMGGEIITIGSDSHKKEHLGAYIKETIQELKSMGFKRICTFDKMHPAFHEIA